MVAAIVNDDSIKSASWMAFLSLIPAGQPDQVLLFSMSDEELVEFEAYVQSPQFELISQLQAGGAQLLDVSKHI